MSSIVLEIVSAAVGAVAGVLACAFIIVAARGLVNGRAAYETNRAVTNPNVWSTLKGELKHGDVFDENRTNHGIAIDLKSKKLIPQQKLSSDAIDDVIGRNA